MASTIVLGLAILSAANYGYAFEFSGLDPSVQSKTAHVKPTINPYSVPTTNQPQQVKSAFAFKSAVAPKPSGTPFESFKPQPYQPYQQYQQYQPYQPYQPYQQYQPASPFRASFQPETAFGPYPGFPAYPGQASGYQPAPAAYQQQQPLGFAPAVKFGAPKKFNKNSQGFADFNLPGKYFQEHQFGAYHGPEFSSALVPADHHLKQSKPKDTLLGKPAVSNFPEFGLTKQAAFGGFVPPQSFGFPALPNFQQYQPFINTVPSVKSATTENSSPVSTGVDAVVTSSAAPASQDESASSRLGSSEDGTTSSNDEVTVAGVSAVESSTDNQVPAIADDGAVAVPAQNEQSNASGEPAAIQEPAQEPAASQEPAQEPAQEQQAQEQPAQEQPAQEQPVQDQPAQKPSIGTVVVEDIKDISSAAPEVSSDRKSEKVDDNKAIGQSTVDLPDLPKELYAPAGPLPVSDPSAVAGLFGGFAGFPYSDQSAGFQQQQPSFYDAPKFTDEELRAFAVNFANTGLDVGQIFGPAVPAVKVAGNSGQVAVGGEGVEINESAANAEKSADGADEKSADKATEKSADKATEKLADKAFDSGEKKESEAQPKKSNTVQIVQDNVFNGQLPVLFDPSNRASPLDAYKFYSHPSVSGLSNQASLVSYSPEDAFSNFGSQFHQSYLIGGSPSLIPITKTVVQTGQVPISIASAEHPLHSQVFKYSQSFLPYPQVAQNANALRSFDVSSPSPSTVAPSTGVSTSSSAPEAVSIKSDVVSKKA